MSEALLHQQASPADRLAPCCEETLSAYAPELEAAAHLAQVVRSFLAGTPYRHTPPTQVEKDELSRALYRYDNAERGC